MVKSLPKLPNEFKDFGQFIKCVNALLDLYEDEKKLKSTPAKDLKEYVAAFRGLVNAEMKKALDFSDKAAKSPALDKERSKELQAGSARYFAGIAANYKKQDAVLASVLEKESLNDNDLKALKAGLEGLQEVLLEAAPAEEKSLLKGILKDPDAGKLLSMLKDGLKNAPAKVRKGLEPLIQLLERMENAILNKQFPDDSARIDNRLLIEVFIVAVSFQIVAQWLTILVTGPFVDSVYHASYHDFPAFFNFLVAIGFFVPWDSGHGTIRAEPMLWNTYYLTCALIIGLMVLWWKKRYSNKK